MKLGATPFMFISLRSQKPYCAKSAALRGTTFTIDAHSMGSILSTPFFPRR